MKPVAESLAAIESLDLGPVMVKLMHEDCEGWSRPYVEELAVAYKRYLTLLAKYPDADIAPTRDVDTFWHQHILDTMKYAEDCENIFGYFLHHFPYSGMRGEEDRASHFSAADAMHELYEREFGEPMPNGDAWAGEAKADRQPGAWSARVKPEQMDRQASAWSARIKPEQMDRQASAWSARIKPDHLGRQETAWSAAAGRQASAWSAAAGRQAAAWSAASGRQAAAWSAASGRQAGAWSARIKSGKKLDFVTRPTLETA